MLGADPELRRRLRPRFEPSDQLIARRDGGGIRNVASHCDTFNWQPSSRGHSRHARQFAAAVHRAPRRLLHSGRRPGRMRAAGRMRSVALAAHDVIDFALNPALPRACGRRRSRLQHFGEGLEGRLNCGRIDTRHFRSARGSGSRGGACLRAAAEISQDGPQNASEASRTARRRRRGGWRLPGTGWSLAAGQDWPRIEPRLPGPSVGPGAGAACGFAGVAPPPKI